MTIFIARMSPPQCCRAIFKQSPDASPARARRHPSCSMGLVRRRVLTGGGFARTARVSVGRDRAPLDAATHAESMLLASDITGHGTAGGLMANRLANATSP